MTERYDGDSEESRDAFRAYDDNEPVFRRSAWQIWRDACAWQAARATSVDAKRYRMVRQGKALTVRVPVKDKHVTYCIGDKPESGFPEAFDEAIDAAIESQRSGDGS